MPQAPLPTTQTFTWDFTDAAGNKVAKGNYKVCVEATLKNEYRILMTYLEKTDPDAFVTIYSVHEVHYRPKPRRQRVKETK